MTLEERMERGRRAAQLLADEMFTATGLDVSAAIKDDLFRTKPEEGDKREALYAEYRGFRRVLERLSTWKSDGQMATAEAERLDEQAKRS